MTTRTATSFCRICPACCVMVLTIDDNERIVNIKPDKQHPMTKGYACFKGLQAEDAHHSPRRILRPLKRQPDGTFTEISSEQAFDEIAEKMRAIIDREGVEAISMFTGNGSVLTSSAVAMQSSFWAALGSTQRYSTMTLDQSAKIVSFERMGGWAAGMPDLEQSNVALMFASNPLNSHSATGYLVVDPTRRLKRAKARGLKLIVIDPRDTETARHADLFVQPLPGQDAVIAAGLLRIILREGWHDREFCDRYVSVSGLQILREMVKPFTPDMVATRAGIESAQLHAVAEMFARDHKKGHAYASTGTNMAPYSNVAQHMVDCLNVVCGRFRRPGDRMVVDMLAPESSVRAEVIPPPRSWQQFPASRIRGIGRLMGEKLSGTLAEEILTPGEGQINVIGLNRTP
jgi:anaerobic selenocysteine-containing dehydrogenase